MVISSFERSGSLLIEEISPSSALGRRQALPAVHEFGALAYRIQVVFCSQLAVLKDNRQSIFTGTAVTLHVLDRVELARLRPSQDQPAVLRVLSRIGDRSLVYRRLDAVNLGSGALECELRRIAIELLEQGSVHAEGNVVGAPSVELGKLEKHVLDGEHVDAVVLNHAHARWLSTLLATHEGEAFNLFSGAV